MTKTRCLTILAALVLVVFSIQAQSLPVTCAYTPGRAPRIMSMPVGSILSTAVTRTGTTLTVSSGTSVSNGDYLQIEDEVVHVTAGGGTTSLTVARGTYGTQAAHAAGVGFTDLNVSYLGYCVNGIVLQIHPFDLAYTQWTEYTTFPAAASAVVGRLYLWKAAGSANTCPGAGAAGTNAGSAYAICVTLDGAAWKAINLN